MTKPIKEDSQTEFKSSFNDAVIKSLSAFANTKGARVLVGLMDTGQPVKRFYLGMRLCFIRIVYLARLNNLGNVPSLKVRFVNAKPFSLIWY